ncbi:anti-sigma factor [candidate division TA06 bacterium]|nr:anti-sigma factor [candidate division TA06 bacterium]
MDHEDLRKLLEAYALGALDDEELQSLEAHLESGCQKCEEDLRDLSELTARLSLASPQHTPSPRVKEQLMSSLKEQQFEARVLPIRLRRLGWVAAGIAAVVVLALGLRTINLHQEIAKLRKDLAEVEDVTDILSSPGMEFVDLKGVEPNTQAFGKVVLDPELGAAVVHMYRLPKTPEGMEYQLWVMREGKPTSAGLFTVSEDGRGILKLRDLPDPGSIASYAVTIEPKGGQPEPTGMMYLTGPEFP